MTKPHEETWIAMGKDVLAVHPESHRCAGTVDKKRLGAVSIESDSYARLAAQAPAMARLLLTSHVHADGLCAFCGGVERVGPFGSKYRELVDVPHEPDCELATVLRAAGVLPKGGDDVR